MKTLTRTFLGSLFLLTAAVVFGTSMPQLDVTVSNASGKMVFKGRTTAAGTFATGKLEPGNYVVQFKSNDSGVKKGKFTVVASAGKKKVSANAVEGSKFLAGGVAMKVDVGAGLNITGQVADGAAAAASDANVKIINGKRFVWIKGGDTGSNIGGRWVAEDSFEARTAKKSDNTTLHQFQEKAGDQPREVPVGR